MSSLLWDTFTGNASYREVMLRALHPGFMGWFGLHLVAALVSGPRAVTPAAALQHRPGDNQTGPTTGGG
jgi:hypothetical protein